MKSRLDKVKKTSEYDYSYGVQTECICTKYTVFSISSDTRKWDEYFTMAILLLQLSLKVVMPMGNISMVIIRLALRIKPGQWNSVTFTVERSNARPTNGDKFSITMVSLSSSRSQSGRFIKTCQMSIVIPSGTLKRKTKKPLRHLILRS